MRLQCSKCPWKKSTDPHDIPNGYSEEQHAGLSCTIAEPGTCRLGGVHMMACHETPPGKEKPCVGWLDHQLGPGNNIGLRLMAMSGRIEPFRTVGEQHERFEDTLPKKRRKAKRSLPTKGKER